MKIAASKKTKSAANLIARRAIAKKTGAKKTVAKKYAASASKKPRATRPAEPARIALVPSQEVIAFAASHIRDIPDFPKKGIVFKDITPLLANPRAFHIVLDTMAERFIGEHIDAVVGVEEEKALAHRFEDVARLFLGLAGGTLAYKDQELTLFRRGQPELARLRHGGGHQRLVRSRG